MFDGRGMWVSRVLLNEVQKFDPSGAITLKVPIEGPAGMAMGPDGLLYVNQDLVGVSRAQIARFDPTDENPVPETFATGLPGANGLAADEDGNLYVGIVGPMCHHSDLQGRPDGHRSGVERAGGLANARGRGAETRSTSTLYDSTPDEPFRWTTGDAHKFAQLTPDLELGSGVPPKVLDDLTMGSDGRLYTVAYASGELLRVDVSSRSRRHRGEVCVVANGFTTPTSVHAPEAFGEFDPDRHMFVTTATG